MTAIELIDILVKDVNAFRGRAKDIETSDYLKTLAHKLGVLRSMIPQPRKEDLPQVVIPPPPPQVATPGITKSGNKFPYMIAMNCFTPGASIYFTVNTGDPTEKSWRYNAPFPVTEPGHVKARAFKPGMTPSVVSTLNL